MNKFEINSLVNSALLFGALISAGCGRTMVDKSDSFCINNLRIIEGAKLVWAVEHRKTTNDVPTDADLFGPGGNVAEKPSCPSGGTYTIGKVGEPPRCSVSGHLIASRRP